MANVKISNLPAATSPVASTDVIPVVQGGVTKKAAINQLGFLQAGTGAVTRTAQAKMRDTVSVKDFGAVGDGTTDDTAAIQAAINATPIGGTLYFNLDGVSIIDTLTTVKIESDLGNNWLYGGLLINKPMRVIGNKNFKLKIKNFSTAWAAQDVGDSICAVLVTSSLVHIDGLNIDANANNHYELAGAVKWWEDGPTLKRPPCGISVSVAMLQANVKNVLIENCVIEQPLAGVSFIGNAVDAARADFLSGKLATGVVKDCVSRNNTIVYARGNGVLFNIGVDNCVSDSDVFINGMYHDIRMYSRAINCKAVNCRSHTNCDEIIARYNSTDLGYWRTTDSADPSFKIIRAGFHIGGADSYSATYGYSVVNCGFVNCEYLVSRPTVATYTDYFTPSSVYHAAFSSTSLPNCYVESCRSVNADYGVVLYFDSIAPAETYGLRAVGNHLSGSYVADIYVQGVQSATVENNTVVVNPGLTYTPALLIDFVKGIFSENSFSGTPTASTYAVSFTNSVTSLLAVNNTFAPSFIKVRRYVQTAGSTPKMLYPGRVLNLIDAEVISGGALSNSWAVAYVTPAEGQENQVRVNQDGSVALQLRLSGAAATALTVATLITQFRPKETVGFVATELGTGGAYWGRVLTDGRIQINLPAFPSAALTQIYAEVTLNPV